MGKCKHETSNGRCGLKESYAYRHKCYTEECCKCHESIEPCGRHEPMTNADRIRAMSDEELAKWLCSISTAECCDRSCPARDMCDIGDNGMIKWLKQPAETEPPKEG